MNSPGSNTLTEERNEHVFSGARKKRNNQQKRQRQNTADVKNINSANAITLATTDWLVVMLIATATSAILIT